MDFACFRLPAVSDCFSGQVPCLGTKIVNHCLEILLRELPCNEPYRYCFDIYETWISISVDDDGARSEIEHRCRQKSVGGGVGTLVLQS